MKPTKKKHTALIAALLLCGMTGLLPCQRAAAETNGTISVVSFDGLGYQDSQRYIKKGLMPSLKRFQDQAAAATNFTTVTPSLTAPSHAAMATGASPAQTGIVSNQFHTTGDKVKTDTSGFSQTVGVTPIWKEAENQGKITATVAFPDSNPENASAATYAVYSGGTLADSKLHDLKFSAVSDERLDQLPDGSENAEEAVLTLDVKDAPSQQLFILKAENEGPLFYLSQNRSTIGKELTTDGWTAVTLDLPSEDSVGFYVKLKGDADKKGDLRLFQGTIMGSIYQGPGSFADDMHAKFGFYPAPDEMRAFKAGEITREEYEQAGKRFTDWITDVSLHVKDTYHPDLLFYYYPVVDTELHEFLLRDPAQPGYSDNVQNYEKYVSWAFGQADNAIGRITDDLKENDHLLLISDHGLEPIHTRLSPNRELEKAGLLVKDENGKIDSSKTKAYAEASGTIAHVYVNLKGREKKGIVDPAEYEQVKQEIVSVFKNGARFSPRFRDPRKVSHPIGRWLTGNSDIAYPAYQYPTVPFDSDELEQETPYEKVWTADDRAYASIFNNNSGDVFLSAASGFLMGKDAEIAMEPTLELGSHGGSPMRPSLHPMLYAAGPDIQPGDLDEPITMTDIAPSLYKLLSLQAPDFIEGRPIW
ncbi:hypothetical protein NCCP2716_13780 [Sporosarcina sp. NCCP-2716]|uniref:alkaline phosphatase family protein n=1 Tax=Sporosarcina sp. NCCP-2716 TaxID=2943679 RepID=UPI00203D63A3|nr:alkaline phosphatase family protein [Sporosarcina sp. NCCP-2716]GKV68880.1 hypothetical protein NCCP2716_13780 [Sporosarcina sp. NCCP-2716]